MSKAAKEKDSDDRFEMSADELSQKEGQKVPAAKGQGPRLVPKPGDRREVAVDQALPGMEEVVIQELIDAAGSYAASRDDRLRAGKIEKQDKDFLFDLMDKHEKSVYESGGIRIEIKSKVERKIKVITIEDPATAESEPEEGSE
jgi:hypothetical protein